MADTYFADELAGAGVNALNPNQFAIISDSRGANFHVVNGASVPQVTRKSAQNPIVWMMALMGQRLRCVFNGGLAGKRSDQWQLLDTLDSRFPATNNLTAALSTKALWFFFAGIGVNDIAQGRTADEIWAGYNSAPGMKAMLLSMIRLGRRPVLFGETGAGGAAYTAAMVAETHRLNRYLRGFCATNPQAIYADVPGAVWDARATAATNGITQKANFYPAGDLTHMQGFGAFYVGQHLAALMSPFVPPLARLVTSMSEIPANGQVQFVPTPLLAPLSVSPATAGFTFNTQVPASIAFLRGLGGTNGGGAATATVDVAADPTGYGNGLTIAANFTQANEWVRFDVTCAVAGIAGGDRLFGSMQADVTASAGARNPDLYIRAVADSTTITASDLENDPWQGSSYGAMPDVATSLVMETELLTVPAFTSSVAVVLRGTLTAGAGGGSQTVRFSRVGVHKHLG